MFNLDRTKEDFYFKEKILIQIEYLDLDSYLDMVMFTKCCNEKPYVEIGFDKDLDRRIVVKCDQCGRKYDLKFRTKEDIVDLVLLWGRKVKETIEFEREFEQIKKGVKNV